MKPAFSLSAAILPPIIFLFSCGNKKGIPSAESMSGLDLKRGEVITCGPADRQLGKVEFAITGDQKVQQEFNLALSLLHSFEYVEAEKVFARVIDQDPGCAMAFWGVAMANFHPLWAPPSPSELKKGNTALALARSAKTKTEKESAYIEALSAFYNDWEKVDHRTRSLRFEKAMENVHNKFADDKESSILYALALTAAADPADKTFQKQKKAGAILTALQPALPDHPGIIHYIIHTYDSPELAPLALAAARKYASVAPSSAHALHMPSHIFTRLGLWDESIQSNLASVASAKCYAEQSGMKGHWDEELHGMDYLVYAYLQKGENDLAKKQWEYLNKITSVEPLNFKVAYAFAAIPCRYLMENKQWQQAAHLKIDYKDFPWQKFPWQNAVVHFTRLMGAAHTGNRKSSDQELKELVAIHDMLLQQKDSYNANQVQINIQIAEAWLKYLDGDKQSAIMHMNEAADMEDKTQKHPVTPGPVIPARELLAELFLVMNEPAKALEAFEADLKTHANRFNGLYGAGYAAEKSGNIEKATFYYSQLLKIANVQQPERKELKAATAFLLKHKQATTPQQRQLSSL